MKVFQMRTPIILILSFSLIGSGILVPNSSAQDAQIPDWIKNVAELVGKRRDFRK